MLSNHFQTSHVSCGWWEEEPYWFWVTGSKVKVNCGTLCIRPCGHDSDYSFCPITFKLYMYVVDDEGRTPIDFGSWVHRSRSTLPPCEGMPHFALASLIIFDRICSTLMSSFEDRLSAFCASWRNPSYWSPWCPPSGSVWSTVTPMSDGMLCWPYTRYTGIGYCPFLEPLMPAIRQCLEHRHSYVRRNAVLAIYTIYRYRLLSLSGAPDAGH